MKIASRLARAGQWASVVGLAACVSANPRPPVTARSASPTTAPALPIPPDSPAWLKQRIEASAAHLDAGSAVLEYTVAGKKYYELPVPCCDVLVPLYSESGALVCHPSGGFSGHGDGKCGNLFQGDVPARVVWKK